MRNLEIIGEAANNTELQFREQYTNIPWRRIINFRNVLIHDYVDIDLDLVWKIITTDLESLQAQIHDILSREKVE